MPEHEEKTLNPTELESLVEQAPDFQSKVYVAALYYASLGIPVIPLRPGEKSLPSSSTGVNYNMASTNKSTIDRWFKPGDGRFCGHNIGIVCGRENGVAAVDIDKKSGVDGFQPWTELQKQHGPLSGVPVQKTPSGGEHYLFRWVPGMVTTTSKLGRGIDTRGGNHNKSAGHIVAFPSRIGEGIYRWARGGLLEDPPLWIPRLVGEFKGRGSEEVGEGDAEQVVSLDQIRRMLAYIDPALLEYQHWVDIGMSIHSQHPGEDGLAVWDEWSSRDRDRYTKNKPGELGRRWGKFDSSGRIRIATLFYHAKKGGWSQENQDVDSQLLQKKKTKAGTQVKDNLSNCIAVLTHEDMLPGISLKFDSFTGSGFLNGQEKKERSIIVTEIRVALEHAFKISWAKQTVEDAVEWLSKEHFQFDSLMDYLKSLGKPSGEAIAELCTRLGLSDELDRLAVRRWMIGAIARALEPGCKNDSALILVGAQGIGKSSLFRALCPHSNWFTDGLKSLGEQKDDLLKLPGRWIIELAELSQIRRAEQENVKHFMSQVEDLVRRPYSRDTIRLPRRFAICGTTNSEQILSDPTGNRRFWPVKTTMTYDLVKWVQANRDGLWAEALAAYNKNERWWFNYEEEGKRSSHIVTYNMADEWTDSILEWAKTRTRFRMVDLAKEALGVEPKDLDVLKQHRIGNVLRQAGFESKPYPKYPGRRWNNPSPDAKDVKDEF